MTVLAAGGPFGFCNHDCHHDCREFAAAAAEMIDCVKENPTLEGGSG